MVIQMITCQIRKDTTGKVQAADALLMDGMGAALHKGIGATGLHHLRQQFVERNRVGRSMVGRNRLVVNIIAHGGTKPYLIAESAEHLVEHGGNGGFPFVPVTPTSFSRDVGSP